MLTAPHKAFFVAAVFGLGLGTSSADEQAPRRTTATYDDWTIVCVTPPGPDGRKSCEVVASQTLKGNSNPISQITIRENVKNDSFKLFLQVPTNVWLQTGVKFHVTDKDPGFAVAFKWCVPSRCLADTDLTKAALGGLNLRSVPGQIEFKDALQRDVKIPVSFKGLSEALVMLKKE